MPRKFWLMKCEPGAYSIADLERDGTTGWEGVRNFQARNLLRDTIQKGDLVLFYASNADPSGVTGIAEVSKEGFPDPLQFDPKSGYFDERSSRENPQWYSVEISFVERFREIVPLDALRQTAGLESMVLLRKGSRLSVQPVTREEFEIIRKLGRSKPRR